MQRGGSRWEQSSVNALMQQGNVGPWKNRSPSGEGITLSFIVANDAVTILSKGPDPHIHGGCLVQRLSLQKETAINSYIEILGKPQRSHLDGTCPVHLSQCPVNTRGKLDTLLTSSPGGCWKIRMIIPAGGCPEFSSLDGHYLSWGWGARMCSFQKASKLA